MPFTLHRLEEYPEHRFFEICVRKDGENYPILIPHTLLCDANKSIWMVIGTIIDGLNSGTFVLVQNEERTRYKLISSRDCFGMGFPKLMNLFDIS